VALATAQFGGPGLYSDWGIIGLAQSTNMLETRVWLHPTPAPREESLQTKCKPTRRHRRVSGIIGRHRHGKIGEPERTLIQSDTPQHENLRTRKPLYG
jgi:hypothetical protein